MAHRLLLKEWLVSKLDSQAYPNVCWLDKGHNIFAVPWRHQGSHDFDDVDAAIFKDWSLASGCYKESETSTHWKTRFRSAISKSSYIQEIKDAKVTSSDNKPYKIYQIVDSPIKKTKPSAPPQSYTSASTENTREADRQCHEISTGPMIPTVIDEEFSALMKNAEMGDVGAQVDQYFKEFFADAGIGDGGFDYIDFPDISPLTEYVPDTTLCTGAQPTAAEQMTASMQPRKHKSTTYHSIESQLDMNQKRSKTVDDSGQIEIYYFGNLVTTYRFGQMCHFRHRSDPQSAEGEQLPQYEAFIPPDPSGKRRKHLEMILAPQCIKGGLCVEYNNGSIYATRYCLVNIFYSNFADPKQSYKLSRNERTCIFDYEVFTRAVNEWHDLKNCKKPSDCVYLGFARRWFLDDDNGGEMSAIVKSRRVQSDLGEMMSLEDQMDSLEISEQSGAKVQHY